MNNRRFNPYRPKNKPALRIVREECMECGREVRPAESCPDHPGASIRMLTEADLEARKLLP